MAADLYRTVAGLADGELIELAPQARPDIPPDCLLAELGMALTHVGRGRSRAMMPVTARHLNQRGLVQAGAMVAFADAAAGWAAYTAQVDRAVQTLLLCGEEAKRLAGDMVPMQGAPGAGGRLAFTVFRPLGVVCAITPFNSPLNSLCTAVCQRGVP